MSRPFIRPDDYVIDRDGCWLWAGHTARDGYGRLNRGGGNRPQLAHRVAYELWVGPIPALAQVHHRCEQRACINPDHLHLARTDGEHKRLHAATRTHCRRGHDYAEHGRRHKSGARYCRACERENDRRRRAALRG